jgi:predicted restriction endonuclease
MLVKNDTEFQQYVCSRDNYQCQICKTSFNYGCHFNENGVNQYVVAHHILSKASRPDLRLETDNGVCLCDEDHKGVHNGTCKL